MLGRAIIFVKNNEVVYEIYSDFKDANLKNEEFYLTFIKDEDKANKYFTKSTAIFRIDKKVESRGEGFLLLPIK